MIMKTSDFIYQLPEELIAQEPVEERDTSRLLNLNRGCGDISHHSFSDLLEILEPGDRLVFNNTKVIPARLFAFKDTGVRVELLFTERITNKQWKIIAKPARRLKIGTVVHLELDENVKILVEAVTEDGGRIVTVAGGTFDSIDEILEKYGAMPLPPYIEREAELEDRDRYQTVYAEKKGAIAAPTAGLHFTDRLIKKLNKKGINSSFVTLHVGIGTFRPVKSENPNDHPMHSEEYILDPQTVDEIRETQEAGGRIIAVGTTSVRVLEHCSRSGELVPGEGSTDIFIMPGWHFKTVDGLITNFHLPGSTLLMLVSALAGRENILKAYEEAVRERYRFFSYGDAMIII